MPQNIYSLTSDPENQYVVIIASSTSIQMMMMIALQWWSFLISQIPRTFHEF